MRQNSQLLTYIFLCLSISSVFIPGSARVSSSSSIALLSFLFERPNRSTLGDRDRDLLFEYLHCFLDLVGDRLARRPRLDERSFSRSRSCLNIRVLFSRSQSSPGEGVWGRNGDLSDFISLCTKFTDNSYGIEKAHSVVHTFKKRAK